jgi:glycosyltransferase involved in cell wall biosynthesis
MSAPAMSSAPQLSIVMPAYNEADTILHVVNDVIQVMDTSGVIYELICVDDGSIDDTPAILRALAIPEKIVILSHPYNKGLGSSLRTGMRAARGVLVAWMDSDGQNKAADLLKMIPLMEKYDLVVGARKFADEGKWYRNLANHFYNGLSSWLANFKIEDLTSGFRMFRTDVVRKYLALIPSRYSAATTTTLVLLKGGYNLKYVPIDANPRQGGKSNIRLFRDGFRFVTIIFKIVMLFEPLRFFIPISFISFGLSLAFLLYTSFEYARPRIPNSAVVFFVLGVMSFLLGLVAEQIAMLQTTIHNKGD